jgi:hypothetical protein
MCSIRGKLLFSPEEGRLEGVALNPATACVLGGGKDLLSTSACRVLQELAASFGTPCCPLICCWCCRWSLCCTSMTDCSPELSAVGRGLVLLRLRAKPGRALAESFDNLMACRAPDPWLVEVW